MQKLLSIALIFGFSIVAVFPQDCTNPLLNRTDIQSRFGGSANILNTSRVAGNLSGCSFLKGQNVCVSDDGFVSLQKFLDDFKNSFSERSQKSDQSRYGGIEDAMNRTEMNDTGIKALYTLGMLFNQTILSFNVSGATQPYNFTAFYNMVQRMGLTSNQSSKKDQKGSRELPDQESRGSQSKGHGQGQGPRALQGNVSHNGSEPMGNFSDFGNSSNRTAPMPNFNRSNDTNSRNRPQPPMGHPADRNGSMPPNDTNNTGMNQSQNGNLRRLQAPNGMNNRREASSSSDHMRQNWRDLQKNLMQAKSKCAVSVMKHMYFTSCMAAAANVTALNQSNISGSAFKIRPDSCSGFKDKCLDYFTYSAAAESTRAIMMNANSSFASELYAILTSSNDTTAIFDKLNTLATTVLAEMNVSEVNSTYHNASGPLTCNSTNSNASDCNYICTNVLNGTGFDEDAFNSPSSTNSTSRRRLYSSSVVTVDPSGANSDLMIGDDDAAVVVSESWIPDSSSGSKVVASLVIAMTSLFLSVMA